MRPCFEISVSPVFVVLTTLKNDIGKKNPHSNVSHLHCAGMEAELLTLLHSIQLASELEWMEHKKLSRYTMSDFAAAPLVISPPADE